MVTILIYYNYFNNCYKMIARDLSEQQALDGNPKLTQQISFTGNLDREESATIFEKQWRSNVLKRQKKSI